MNGKRFRNILVFLLALSIIGGTLFFGKSYSFSYSIEKNASNVLEKCKDELYRPSCYEREVPALLSRISMEDAFRVTALVQRQDPSFAYCHVLGHKIAAKEVAKDPAAWESVVSRCPSGLCSNGCIHGAFQERFRKETFSSEEINKYKMSFANICEEKKNWNPTRMEQSSCYHALGHLLMYVTGANISQSINLCRELAIKDNGRRDLSQICFDGAFMQIFQPLEPDDFELIKGKEILKENAASYCSMFTGNAQGSCRSESWPLFRRELADPKYTDSFCSYLEDSVEKRRCVSSLIYVLTAQFNFNSDKMEKFCEDISPDSKPLCISKAASRMLENDFRGISKAVDFCGRAEKYGLSGFCYDELLNYSQYNFHAESEEFHILCDALPQLWRGRCLGRR